MVNKVVSKIYARKNAKLHGGTLLGSLALAFITILLVTHGGLYPIPLERNDFFVGLLAYTCQIFMQVEIGIFVGFYYIHRFPLKLASASKASIIINIALLFVLIWVSVLFVSESFNVVYLLYHGVNGVNLYWTIINRWTYSHSFGRLLGSFLGILICIVIFLFSQWTQGLQRERKLKEEKLIFQYQTLINQVNPHFLFNSLNTLSSLVLGNPPMAEIYINKLSSIYRYILENKDIELVDLKTEIEFAKDYFSLIKIRDEDKIQLTIELNEDTRCKILPISLQILIENALKHNSATKENPLHISIEQEAHEFVTVRNNLQRKMNIENSSFVGLKNLAERVKLVTQKEIIVKEMQSEFIVTVPLIS